MKHRYALQGMRDDDLKSELRMLVQRSNEHTSDVLAHLAEFEARQLYSSLGFQSMWEYTTEQLGICQTTAWRKLAAARVCREYPGTFERVAKGELQVCVLSALSEHLTPTNAEELLTACVGMSFRKVPLLLAERFPKPDVSDSIRRKPSKQDDSTCNVGSESELGDVETGTGQPSGPAPSRPARPIEPLSRDRFAVRFTADGEFVALLDQVRDLASHRGSHDLLSILKAGLEAFQRELLKQRFGVGRTPRPAKAAESAEPKPAQGPRPEKPEPRKRAHIPIPVAREVYERDGGQCTFVSADGRRCTSRRRLELDHIDPDAVGGPETTKNLRLLCDTHNQLAARNYFGKGYMRAVMKRVRASAKEDEEEERPVTGTKVR